MVYNVINYVIRAVGRPFASTNNVLLDWYNIFLVFHKNIYNIIQLYYSGK